MRPCGGFTPDMINFAHSTDVYKIWADMIAYDSTLKPTGPHYYCIFSGRRNGKNFKLSHEELLAKYGYAILGRGYGQLYVSGYFFHQGGAGQFLCRLRSHLVNQ